MQGPATSLCKDCSCTPHLKGETEFSAHASKIFTPTVTEVVSAREMEVLRLMTLSGIIGLINCRTQLSGG